MLFNFHDRKGKLLPDFDDPKCLAGFAFLMDISFHLNELNFQLQQLHQSFSNWNTLSANFKTRLMPKQQPRDPALQYVAAVSRLQTEFLEKFKDFHSQERILNVIVKLFSVNVMETPGDLNMKIIHI